MISLSFEDAMSGSFVDRMNVYTGFV